jgi:L-alanine-DL-glutamate epimerase-like enolase superfamily enzyme
VLCEARAGDAVGRGEGTPIYYHGETAEDAAARINALGAIAHRAALQQALPRGAARNAADAALWELEAAQTGVPVWQRAGLAPPQPLPPPTPSRSGTRPRWRAPPPMPPPADMACSS